MVSLKTVIGALSLVLASSLAVAAPVNVNTADAQMIATAMVGIGVKKAEEIVAFRKQHGPFKSVEDLAQVKGIGEKIVQKNRENITVGR